MQRFEVKAVAQLIRRLPTHSSRPDRCVAMSDTPLVPGGSESLPPLYDAASMLEMDAEVARGFIVLLGGEVPMDGRRRRTNNASPQELVASLDDSALTLGFLALTQGNTVDACLGVSGVSSRDSKGRQCARKVKELLADAADSNADLQRMAVGAYQEAFHVIFNFAKRAGRLNFFTRCFCYRRFRDEAEMDLKAAFQHLDEAIQATL